MVTTTISVRAPRRARVLLIATSLILGVSTTPSWAQDKTLDVDAWVNEKHHGQIGALKTEWMTIAETYGICDDLTDTSFTIRPSVHVDAIKVNASVSPYDPSIVDQVKAQWEAEATRVGLNPDITFRDDRPVGPLAGILAGIGGIVYDNVLYPVGFHGAPELRVFEPKARIYFDTGDDDNNEIDLFDDGALAPAISLVEWYWAHDGFLGHEDWTAGPAFGLGLGGPGNDSPDGMNDASGAPVLLVSIGFLFEFPIGGSDDAVNQFKKSIKESDNSTIKSLYNEDYIKKGSRLGVEVGYATGFSTDESPELDDIDDGAIYVGLSLHVEF